jgi:hypothetical protein
MTPHEKWLKERLDSGLMQHRIKMKCYDATMAFKFGFLVYAWQPRFNAHNRLQLI